MEHANVILEKDFVIGEVDPRLFSGFAEHLGRHIYRGIYETGHPQASWNVIRLGESAGTSAEIEARINAEKKRGTAPCP